MSKSQFFEMQTQRIAELYPATFTKKEATTQGVKLVNDLREKGDVTLLNFASNLVRLKAVIYSAETEIRKYLPLEKTTNLGVEFTPVNGGNTTNYGDDEIYQTLKRDLDARVEELKLAQKQDVFDAYGNQVPKVSTTPRKSSTTIKF